MHTDQWDLTESPEIDPFIYGPLNFDKGGNITLGERMVFSTKGARQLAIHVQRNETGPLPHTTYNHKLKIN